MRAMIVCMTVWVAVAPFLTPRQANAEGLDCSSIPERDKRLECFDAAAAAAKGRSIPTEGRWNVVVDRDRITDAVKVIISNTSADAESMLGEQFMLGITCQKGAQPVVVILWHTFLGSRSINVDMRFDKERPERWLWSISRDGTATVETVNGLYMVKIMLEHDVLLTKVLPYRGSSLVAEFKLSGLAPVLEPHREMCGLQE